MKHRAVVIPLIIVFQLLFNTLISTAWILSADSQIIPDGITVKGKAIGGMTRSQAIAFLEKGDTTPLINQTLLLQDGQKNWPLNTSEFNFHYDYSKTIDNALASTQYSSSSARVVNAMKLQAKNLDIPLQVSWDEQKLASLLNSINDDIQIPARDATVDYDKGRFLIEKEQAGEGLDINTTTERIVQGVLSGRTGTLFLAKKTILPTIVSNDLESVNSQLATSSSRLTSLANRTNNIVLAARALDGAVILPGETFSFNQRVGQRTSEKGYKSAPVIEGNKVTNDIGGGICQVSSTLYDASFQAGMAVVEHSNHSLPIKYVSPGKDATVYYNLIDLKLKNNRANPIVISSKVQNNTLVVNLLGSSRDKK